MEPVSSATRCRYIRGARHRGMTARPLLGHRPVHRTGCHAVNHDHALHLTCHLHKRAFEVTASGVPAAGQVKDPPMRICWVVLMSGSAL
jgi:hypothetical protein